MKLVIIYFSFITILSKEVALSNNTGITILVNSAEKAAARINAKKAEKTLHNNEPTYKTEDKLFLTKIVSRNEIRPTSIKDDLPSKIKTNKLLSERSLLSLSIQNPTTQDPSYNSRNVLTITKTPNETNEIIQASQQLQFKNLLLSNTSDSLNSASSRKLDFKFDDLNKLKYFPTGNIGKMAAAGMAGLGLYGISRLDDFFDNRESKAKAAKKFRHLLAVEKKLKIKRNQNVNNLHEELDDLTVLANKFFEVALTDFEGLKRLAEQKRGEFLNKLQQIPI